MISFKPVTFTLVGGPYDGLRMNFLPDEAFYYPVLNGKVYKYKKTDGNYNFVGLLCYEENGNE